MNANREQRRKRQRAFAKQNASDVVSKDANRKMGIVGDRNPNLTDPTLRKKESVSSSTFVLLNEKGQPLLGFTNGKMPGMEIAGVLAPDMNPEVLMANFGGHALPGSPTSAMLLSAEDAINIKMWLAKQTDPPINALVATLVIVPPKEMLTRWLIDWSAQGGASNDVYGFMADKIIAYMNGAKK